MSLVIKLTPTEERRLSAEAKKAGIAPSELVERLVREHMPAIETGLETPATKGTVTLTEKLFEQWKAEDTVMTDEERAENNRIYTEIEKNGIPRAQF